MALWNRGRWIERVIEGAGGSRRAARMVREFGLWASAVGGKIAETSVHTLADLSLPYKLSY